MSAFGAIASCAVFNMALRATSLCEKKILRLKTYARHEFRTKLIPSARPKGIPSGSAWLGGFCYFM
jgi:hypothetical protein